jgi:hypothetical protein
MGETIDPLVARVAACERDRRRLIRLLALHSLALCLLGAILVASCVKALGRDDATPPRTGALRVTELVVVDPAGVERVRIGGDLPDATIGGKRVPRGEKAAGVLLYDGTGQERGGYVTWEPSGNVGLTLDTREGQATLFVAGPESGSAVRLWHGDDAIEMRSDEDGSRLTALEEGRVVLQMPPIAVLGNEACTSYRDARSRLSSTEVMDACRLRYTEAACRDCLGAAE